MINDIWSNPILEILLFCLIKEIMWIALKSQRIYKVDEFGRFSNPKNDKKMIQNQIFTVTIFQSEK